MDKNVIDTEDIVTLIDYNRKIEWKCILVEKLDRMLFEKIYKYYSQERDVISEVGPSECGAVWVHSALGAAIYGKKKGDVVHYNILGKLLSCEIVKFIKGNNKYLM